MLKRKFSLKKQYREAGSYLKETIPAILTITTVLIAGIGIGFYSANYLSSYIDSILRNIVNQTLDLNTPELILFILQNNLQISFFGFLSGIFFGIFPIISTLTNGIVIGYVINFASQFAPIQDILFSFIPHGVFEIPAVIISLSLGLKFPGFLFAKPRKIKQEFKRRFYNSINIFFMIILPLLTIAAIIEGILIKII